MSLSSKNYVFNLSTVLYPSQGHAPKRVRFLVRRRHPQEKLTACCALIREEHPPINHYVHSVFILCRIPRVERRGKFPRKKTHNDEKNSCFKSFMSGSFKHVFVFLRQQERNKITTTEVSDLF